MRVFLALPISDALREEIRAFQDALRRQGIKGRWVRPAALHLTVLFLGEQPEDAVSRLPHTLDPLVSSASPITLHPGPIGCFRLPPRLLFLSWTEERQGAYKRFAEAVRDRVSEAGIGIPDSVRRQEPRPHLTLVRFRGRRESGRLRGLSAISDGQVRWTVPLPEPGASSPCCTFDRMVLYESVLDPGGARYRALHTFRLGHGE